MSKRSHRNKKRRNKKNSNRHFLSGGIDLWYDTPQYPPDIGTAYTGWKKANMHTIYNRTVYPPEPTFIEKILIKLHLMKKNAECMSHKTYECIPVILKLRIPEDAKRICPEGRKCRASYAIVEDIQDSDGNSIEINETTKVYSLHDSGFEYKLGEPVYPTTQFDTNPNEECSSGIHHFVSRKEAVHY